MASKSIVQGDLIMSKKLWVDLPIRLEERGSHVPALAQVGSSSLYLRKWAIGDQLFGSAHIGHDIVLGVPLYLHVHWMQDDADARAVVWQFEYWTAKGHGQAAFDLGSSGQIVDVSQISIGPWYHMIAETGPLTVPDLEPDMNVVCRLERVTNGDSDNAADVFAWEADCHCQIDILGTTNRAPPFYT